MQLGHFFRRTRRQAVGLSLVCALVVALLPAFPATAADDSSIVILPIDRAKFLAGQLFDFKVEALDLPGRPTGVEVKVNGEDLRTYFGKQPQVSLGEKSATVLLRQVSFEQPSPVTVNVRVNGSGWAKSRDVGYEIVLPPDVEKKAKNVILFIGDGMGLPVRTAARILSAGIAEGKYFGQLEMDAMEEYGVVTTSGLDALATDSANSASAYATGHKSAVNAEGVYPDATKDPLDDPRVENISELAKRVKGMSVGIVSTADVTDATPAAMAAHTRSRYESVAIVDQFLQLQPEVLMGGGSAWFLPQSTPGSKRKDERDIISEFEQQGYQFAGSKAELAKAGTPAKLLGLFHLSNMDVYLDREGFKNPDVLKQFTDQPTLWDMTQKAIDILSQNPNGFFLMVEGASVDKQLHPMDWQRAVYDAIEMDKAVGVAKRFAEQNGDTLVIVTADHSHGMSITGTYHELDGKTGREAVRVYEDATYPTFTGRRVVMTGYMAPPVKPTFTYFVLTKVPLSVCPFCSSDADWPADIMAVMLTGREEARPTERPLRVTGRLELGSQTIPETGFVSQARIYAEKVEEVKP